MGVKKELFEVISVSYDSWLDTSVKCLLEKSSDLKWTDEPESFGAIRDALIRGGASREDLRMVVSEILRGQIVSLLTIMDGGSSLSEIENVELVDSEGVLISSDLHNEFVSYLLDTGRMK